MSILSSRSASQPSFTSSSCLSVYSFVQPPAAWSASAPGGIVMDSKIMPVRDIDDAQNGTDTWRVLRGVDLYFAAEGAYERSFASQQFNSPGIWPRSSYMQTRSRGVIESGLWQWAQGDAASKTGLAQCYMASWLSGISSASDLPQVIQSDGQTPAAKPASDTRSGWRYFLDYALGKWSLSDMVSHQADFASGMPLYADAVRRVYYDMSRLQFYVPHTGDGTSWNVSQGYTTSWTRSSWSSLTDYTPLAPPTDNVEVYEEHRRFFDYGTSSERGGWWGFYTNGGTYTSPRTGLLNASGSRTGIFGSEVACYLALHAESAGDNVSQQDIYEFRRVPFSVTAQGQVQVSASEVSNAAWQMVQQNNIAVPRSRGADYRWAAVYLEHISIVCRVSDRTDISQLSWQWQP